MGPVKRIKQGSYQNKTEVCSIGETYCQAANRKIYHSRSLERCAIVKKTETKKTFNTSALSSWRACQPDETGKLPF